MKAKTLSNNRVTRSHAKGASQVGNRGSSVEVSTDASVSKRESGAILQQVREIRDNWSNTERVLRAQLGAQRRAELCNLLFG